MNEQAKNTAEKIVQDAQSGYETLQARLHDINKDIFAGNTKIPPSASGGQFKYGSAEQQFMEEDAQRGEQLAREKAKLAVPSFSESLYPEETPPRMLQSERLEPIRDFNLLEPSGSIDKLASAGKNNFIFSAFRCNNVL